MCQHSRAQLYCVLLRTKNNFLAPRINKMDIYWKTILVGAVLVAPVYLAYFLR